MIQENELLTLLVAVGVLVFAVSNREGLRELPRAGLCRLAFMLLVAGLTFTVLEGVFWEHILNLLEHICYGASSVTLAIWVWLVFKGASPCCRT